jgi:hypothetical protein
MPYIDYINESMRSPEQELEDLKRANGFTDTDLRLNRVGKISKGQISRLITEILLPLGHSFLVLAGWLLVVVAAGWVIWGVSAGLHRDPPLRELTGFAFTKLFILFRGLYVVTFVRIGAIIMVISCVGRLIFALTKVTGKTIGLIGDVLAGKIAMCEGRVYASQEESWGSPLDAVIEQWTRVRRDRPKTYRYAIRDIALDVSYEGFRAVASGGHYKIYYTPRSKLLLSIEPAR